MISKSTVVMYDMDSTIADTRHRWSHTPRNTPGNTWDDYAMQCENDLPILGTVRSMQLHWPHHRVEICTSRPEKTRELTEHWLLTQVGPWWDHLELKPDEVDVSTLSGNADVKIKRILLLQSQGHEVELFYEDIPEVAKRIFGETGVPVMGVNPFYPALNSEGAV